MELPLPARQLARGQEQEQGQGPPPVQTLELVAAWELGPALPGQGPLGPARPEVERLAWFRARS